MTYIASFTNPKISVTAAVKHGQDGYLVTVRDDASGFVFQAFKGFCKLSDAIDCARSIALAV